MFTKKFGFLVSGITIISSVILFTFPQETHAHGYVSSPISRGYQGQLHNREWG